MPLAPSVAWTQGDAMALHAMSKPQACCRARTARTDGSDTFLSWAVRLVMRLGLSFFVAALREVCLRLALSQGGHFPRAAHQQNHRRPIGTST
jgi:hypothetical protein